MPGRAPAPARRQGHKRRPRPRRRACGPAPAGQFPAGPRRFPLGASLPARREPAHGGPGTRGAASSSRRAASAQPFRRRERHRRYSATATPPARQPHCPLPKRPTLGTRTLRDETRSRRPVRRIGSGRVAEWFKAAVLKTAVGASPPWVRIPPLPPSNGGKRMVLLTI